MTRTQYNTHTISADYIHLQGGSAGQGSDVQITAGTNVEIVFENDVKVDTKLKADQIADKEGVAVLSKGEDGEAIHHKNSTFSSGASFAGAVDFTGATVTGLQAAEDDEPEVLTTAHIQSLNTPNGTLDAELDTLTLNLANTAAKTGPGLPINRIMITNGSGNLSASTIDKTVITENAARSVTNQTAISALDSQLGVNAARISSIENDDTYLHTDDDAHLSTLQTGDITLQQITENGGISASIECEMGTRTNTTGNVVEDMLETVSIHADRQNTDPSLRVELKRVTTTTTSDGGPFATVDTVSETKRCLEANESYTGLPGVIRFPNSNPQFRIEREDALAGATTTTDAGDCVRLGVDTVHDEGGTRHCMKIMENNLSRISNPHPTDGTRYNEDTPPILADVLTYNSLYNGNDVIPKFHDLVVCGGVSTLDMPVFGDGAPYSSREFHTVFKNKITVHANRHRLGFSTGDGAMEVTQRPNEFEVECLSSFSKDVHLTSNADIRKNGISYGVFEKLEELETASGTSTDYVTITDTQTVAGEKTFSDTFRAPLLHTSAAGVTINRDGDPRNGIMEIKQKTGVGGGPASGLCIVGGDYSAGTGAFWMDGPGNQQQLHIQSYQNETTNPPVGVNPSILDADASNIILQPIGKGVGIGRSPTGADTRLHAAGDIKADGDVLLDTNTSDVYRTGTSSGVFQQLSDLNSSMMTTNTSQAIPGQKTFSHLNTFFKNVNLATNAELRIQGSNDIAYLRYPRLKELETHGVPIVSDWFSASVSAGLTENTSDNRPGVSYRYIEYGTKKQVFLRGNVEKSSGSFTVDSYTSFFTLPTAVRPTHTHDVSCSSGGSVGRHSSPVYIRSTGVVEIYGISNTSYVSLDGISFWTS